MDDDQQAVPGPSRPRHRKRPGHKSKPLEGAAPESASQAAVPGSSKEGTVTLNDARRKRRGEKKAQKQVVKIEKAREPKNKWVDEWECVPIARNVVSHIPHVWSSDGRFFFTVSHTAVSVHSATPPAFERLSTFGTNREKGHQKAITALLPHPTNPMQLITASDDGTVKIWDWVEGRLIRTLIFAETGKVLQIAVGSVGNRWWVFATAGIPKENHDRAKANAGYYLHFRVLRLPLNPETEAEFLRPIHVGKLSYNPSALVVSPRSTYLVALSANKAYTYRLPSAPTDYMWKPSCVKFVSDQNFTCGAFAPERAVSGRLDEEWFATGDVKGVIRLWHGLAAAFRQVDAAVSSQAGASDPSKALFPETEKRLPTTSLHWHAHAVAAIAFTPSGAQLLSVGEESVLVQWHLASGKREYIPRLGGRAIISLSVKPGSHGTEEEWWMCFADGSVSRVGSASGQVSTVGQGVRLDPLRPKSDSTPYPLAIHPPTRALVLPSSHASTLQFIDPLSSTVMFDLEVAPSNRVSRRDEKELEPVSVEHVAFNDATDGPNRWMATVEGRKGDDFEGGGLVKNLKVWKWNNDRYTISTQLPRPHGTADVSKVVFSSSAAMGGGSAQPYLLTTSVDGVAKLWHVRQAKRTDQGKGKKQAAVELFWSARSTFGYRSLPIHDAAFSSDATILALAHGSVVTLWDVETNTLLKTLDGGVNDSRHVGFVGAESRYLVAAERYRGIAVWDLLSCDVVWSNVNAACHRLIATSKLPFFVAVHEPLFDKVRTVVSVYKPTSMNAIRAVKVHNKIRWVSLVPPASSDVPNARQLQFVGISYVGEVSRFGDRISKDKAAGTNTVRSTGDKSMSIWQEMFGKDAFLEVGQLDEEDVAKDIPRSKVIGGKPTDIFEGASHTLPPVSLLFDAFLEQILVPGSTGKKSAEEPANGKIVYDEEESVDPVRVEREHKNREVSSDDVGELEDFFRQTLDLSSKKASTNGHGHAHAVKRAVEASVGDVDMDASTPVKSVINGATKKTVSTPVTAETAEDADEDGEVELSTSGKKRGKKRKTRGEQ